MSSSSAIEMMKLVASAITMTRSAKTTAKTANIPEANDKKSAEPDAAPIASSMQASATIERMNAASAVVIAAFFPISAQCDSVSAVCGLRR